MTDTTAGPRRRGKRKAPQPGRTVARVIVASLVSLGLATGVGVALVYAHWNGNLNRKDVSGLVTDRPERSGGREVNILVMGDDTRDGKGNKIDGEGGGGSDTTILFHLSADRKFAYGISIPRDTLVDRPECKKEDGSVAPAEAGAMWNAAYAVAGPSCTIQQFEQLTGILVDNYVVVDFSGFKGMVNALGGVEVCIPERIVDEESGITLEAGTREISGDEALAYVRVRKGVAGGDGSDPQRIKRQQAFMASMINTALRADVLAQPNRLASFINATTKSLTTDFENIAQMADLARSFSGIGIDNIDFVTTPWEEAPTDKNRIVWSADVAKLWRLVRQDKKLTRDFLDDSIGVAEDPDGSTSASGSGSGTASGSASAADPSSGATEESSEEPVQEEPASPGLC
ncbi:MAG TPA: LCP family protein [Nocardioides sp.]|nr:LCP family protein [Nocardioides sp.]